jgi:hypothetical protein
MTSYKDIFISRVDEYDEAVGSLLTLGGSVLKYVSNFLISTSSSSSSSSLSSFGKFCFPFVDPSSNLLQHLDPPPLLLHLYHYRAAVILILVCGSILKYVSNFLISTSSSSSSSSLSSFGKSCSTFVDLS